MARCEPLIPPETLMLREALDVAAGLGVREALLTCDTSNVASATVIERSGGRLQDVVTVPATGVHKRRYLVTTTTRQPGSA